MGDWFVWGGFRGPENRAAFGPNRSHRWADFADGTSNTIVAAEGKAKQPLYRDCGLSLVKDPSSVPDPSAQPLDHSGGVNALFGDGSVRFIKDAIAGPTWRALGTIAGGEVVGADSY